MKLLLCPHTAIEAFFPVGTTRIACVVTDQQPSMDPASAMIGYVHQSSSSFFYYFFNCIKASAPSTTIA